MNYPRIDHLLKHVDSKYALVHVASKRARQLNNFRVAQEISLGEFSPPLPLLGRSNTLSAALEEIADGKVGYRYR